MTYTVPPSATPITVSILSDLASDGDIAFDPVLSSFTVTTGSTSVLFGIDSFNINLPEFRAFLTFPLDGVTGQPTVPGDAFILSAAVEVFVNLLDFASTVPTFLDLVQYPPFPSGGLAAVDFDAVVLADATGVRLLFLRRREFRPDRGNLADAGSAGAAGAGRLPDPVLP